MLPGSVVAAAGLASLLVLGVMGYLKLNSNITRLDITKNLGDIEQQRKR